MVPNEQTALALAAHNGHADIVKLLSERGAKMQERAREGLNYLGRIYVRFEVRKLEVGNKNGTIINKYKTPDFYLLKTGGIRHDVMVF